MSFRPREENGGTEVTPWPKVTQLVTARAGFEPRPSGLSPRAPACTPRCDLVRYGCLLFTLSRWGN